MPNNSTTILLVEDNLPDSQYTQELLSGPDYTFVEAISLAAALDCLQSKHVDVVLLDLSLPDSHGLTTLERLVSHCETPIVVLTGLEDIEFAVETLRLGAHDYIVKSRLTPEALARSISYAIESAKRRVIEAQLVEAEHGLRLALEESRTGTWVRTFENDCIIYDDQMKALIGVDDSFGQTFDDFLELVHPDDKEILLHAVLSYSEEIQLEYRVIWPDQSVHWINSRGRTSVDALGNPVRSTGISVDISARKQAEKERSELAAIVESSDAAIIGKTLENIVTSWNNAAEKIYGYSSEEMLGKNISVLFSDDVKVEMAAIHERMLRGEYIEQHESKRIRKDGVSIDCDITHSPLKNEQGTIIGIATIARDITSRKRLERFHAMQSEVTILLLESATLVDVAPRVLELIANVLHWSVGQMWQVDPIHNILRNVGSWHDPKGNYREFDLISRHLTFAEGQDLLGRVWQTKEPEWRVDLGSVADFSRALIATNTNLCFACSFPIMQGHVLGVIEFFNDKPTELDDDVQELMTNVCSQIWQFMNRKLTEDVVNQAIHAQRTIAQAILENAPIGIAKLSKELRFNEVNSAFTMQFGVSMDKLPGKSIFEVTTGLPAKDLLNVVRDGTTFRAENARIVFEGTSEKIDEDVCWDLAAWPIKDTSEAITGVILITADVTERAKLTRQRDDFVATLSHDLKNPLIGQNRMLELLIAGTVGSMQSTQLELLRLLRTSTGDMLELISNLLEVYRYDAGAEQLRFENCDVKEIADVCIAQALPLAERKQISIDSRVASTIILADRTAIRRVLMNLLDNAIKFALVNTEVELWCDTSEHDIVLHIKDVGQVISKPQMQALFQRFGQTDSGRNYIDGTGLGLYLCRRIVESHGGTISCESEPGSGTVFSVCLRKFQTSRTMTTPLSSSA